MSARAVTYWFHRLVVFVAIVAVLPSCDALDDAIKAAEAPVADEPVAERNTRRRRRRRPQRPMDPYAVPSRDPRGVPPPPPVPAPLPEPGRQGGQATGREPSQTPSPGDAPLTSVSSALGGVRRLPIRLSEEASAVGATLDRIERGGPYPYDRDGIVFSNREQLLPSRPRGYYHEFTVPTPGLTHRGARRIVRGDRGDTFYSADHYRSFVTIDPRRY